MASEADTKLDKNYLPSVSNLDDLDEEGPDNYEWCFYIIYLANYVSIAF